MTKADLSPLLNHLTFKIILDITLSTLSFHYQLINLPNFTLQKTFLQSMSLQMHSHVGGEWWDLQGTPLKLYSSLLWWWTNFCFGKHENRKFLVQSLGGRNYGRYETFINSKNIFNGESSRSYLLAANEKNVSKEVHILKNFSLQFKYRLHTFWMSISVSMRKHCGYMWHYMRNHLSSVWALKLTAMTST